MGGMGVKTGQRAILTLLAFFYIVAIAAGLVGYGMNSRFLEPAPYKKAFEESGLYHDVYQRTESDLNSRILKGAQKLELFQNLITPEWVKSQVDLVLEGMLAYLKGERETLPVITYKEIKDKIADRLARGGLDRRVVAFMMGRITDGFEMERVIRAGDLQPFREMTAFLKRVPLIALVVGGASLMIIFFVAGGLRQGKGWAAWGTLLGGFLAAGCGYFLSAYAFPILGNMAGIRKNNLISPDVIEKLLQTLAGGMKSFLWMAGTLFCIAGLVLLLWPVPESLKQKEQLDRS